MNCFLVENPHMQPRKDYEDYSRFINDTYSTEKEAMLTKTCNNLEKIGDVPSKYHNPLNTLRTYSDRNAIFLNKRLAHQKGKNMSFSYSG